MWILPPAGVAVYGVWYELKVGALWNSDASHGGLSDGRADGRWDRWVEAERLLTHAIEIRHTFHQLMCDGRLMRGDSLVNFGT